MIRGANYVNIFDVGAMTDEVADLSDGRAFHIIVWAVIWKGGFLTPSWAGGSIGA